MQVRRSLLALLPSLVALGVAYVAWPLVAPTPWFLLYPAVFLSARIGGLRAAVVASFLGAAAALWLLVGPTRSFETPPGQYLAASVFLVTSIGFGVFHERFRDANRRVVTSLSLAERANAELRKALDERQMFAALVANSSDFIGIADPEGKPVYVNPAGRRMVGLAPDRPVETTTIPEYYPPEQRALASDVIVKSMVETGRWQGETLFRNWQTDEAIPVSDTHFAIRDPADRVLGFGTVTRDISDIARARHEAAYALAELQRTNEAFSSLVALAPEGIFTADRDGRYTDVNAAGCRMLGFTRDELVGKTIRDLTPEDRVPQLERERAQLLAGREVMSEWVLRTKDGSWLPVEVSAKILPDGRWQGFARDISVRKRLEAALHAVNADLVRAQSVAEVGSWRLDIRRNVLVWSDEEYRMFGVVPGTAMTYDTFLACVHPDDRAFVDERWRAALRGEPYDIEHRILVDGDVRWVREKADLEFDEHGTLVGGIGITKDITDRKRREEELRRAQERVELALNGANLGVWDWNVASGEVAFNARWAEMRGYRLDEIRARVDTWISGVHPDDWPGVQRALEDYFEGRRPDYETEHRCRTKSGEWIWVLDRGKVFARDERGKPIRMAGTELDITSRKDAEAALRLSEAKAAGIVSLSADAIISVDDRQLITMFNAGAEKIFGYASAEVLGAPLEILVPERFRTLHAEQMRRFAAAETAARRMGERGASILGLRKDGREFPADAAISKLAVGGTTVLTVALRDVTDQKRLEEEQRFLAEVGSVLASSLDVEATLASIGRLATRAFAEFCVVYLEGAGGMRRLKAVARDPAHEAICEALVRAPFDRTLVAEIWDELEANRSVLIEHLAPDRLESYAAHDEHLRALRALDPRSSITSPLFAHGKLIGAMSFISRVPRRYTTGDVHLAEQIALRAAYAIDNAQLYGAARSAIQMRDSVLGIVAHDLRNPLGTILMQTSLMRLRGADASAKSADVIERSGKRMNRIIQDLLDVTRMEEGRLALERDRVSARQVVADIVDAQRPLATAASLELELDVARDLPEVWADRDRLLQIFENLVGNALKFTEAGGVIRVGGAPRDGDVLFWVADTGAGITPENLPHIFDRFWQERGGARHGVGLGLSIVKGLVEAHGGTIRVESTFGRGTTFFFTIPTAPTSEATNGVSMPA